MESAIRSTIGQVVSSFNTFNKGADSVCIAKNEEFQGSLCLKKDGNWYVTSRRNPTGYVLENPTIDKLLEKFGMITYKKMAEFVGPPDLYLYDDDPEMYYKERARYVQNNKEVLLEKFISALQNTLNDLIRPYTALNR